MEFSSPIVKSDIYALFKVLDRSAYRSIIQFYEIHQNDIAQLDEEECLELNIVYLWSLYETSSYDSFLKKVDALIEGVIYFNIVEFEGMDIYYELLFRKAASLYHTRAYEKAAYICGQLINMKPEAKDARHLLRQIYVDRKPIYLQYARGAAVGLFLATAVFCAVELLMLSSSYGDLQPTIEVIRVAVFSLGIAVLGGSQLFHYLQSNYRIQKQIRRKSN